MTETELAALCAAITPPDKAARAAAHAHWASLAKPLGGLGGLETTIEDAAALTGSAKLDISRRAVLVLCADNGVVAQGVSQTDSSVTRAVAENLAARRTSVCRMAQTARCEVVPVDMGIAGEPVAGVLDCRIAPGTADFTLGPAMSRAQAVEAVGQGIRLVQEQKKAGVGLLATGEMGIGNTTTSSAVAAVLLGQPVERRTGPMPAAMASTACWRVMAGPVVKSAVPAAMRQFCTPGTGSPAMPRSTGTTSQRAVFAI